MNNFKLAMFLLLLTGGVTLAAVYKWVDETGRIHYGDTPPEAFDAQPVAVPEGPSQADIERARQQSQEKIKKYEKFSDEVSPSRPLQDPSRVAQVPVIPPDNLVCFSPLSEVLAGTSTQSYASVSSAPLTGAQQGLLNKLFRKADARWLGTIFDLTCTGSASEPGNKIMNLAVRTTADWNAWRSRLTIETDATGKESGKVEQLNQIFEVGDALYFADFKTDNTIARDGNRVALLTLDENTVAFFIERRIYQGPLRVDVRYLKISARKMQLKELYYYNSMLTGYRIWDLGR